jgi:periplasmic protein TonB
VVRRGGDSTVPVGLAGTTLAHGAIVAAILLFSRQVVSTPQVVYAVDMVAAPAPEVVHGHLATQAAPTVKKETVPVAPPRHRAPAKPKPKPTPPPKNVKQVETPAVTRTPETPAPGQTPSTGQDKATVSQPGLQFPYPEYLRNIENRIAENWHRPPGTQALEADISFVIHRDGSVTDIKFQKRSTNYTFDVMAEAAIETAANTHAFGPLPTGFPNDILPIEFSFSPKTP